LGGTVEVTAKVLATNCTPVSSVYFEYSLTGSTPWYPIGAGSYKNLIDNSYERWSINWNTSDINDSSVWVRARMKNYNDIYSSWDRSNGSFIVDNTAPDLVVTNIDAPASATEGSNIMVFNTVQNQGSAATGGFYIYYYLSANTIITASDTKIGQRYVSSLGAGSSSSDNTSLTLPSGVTGSCYVGAIVDATNAVNESKEDNNTGYDAITVIEGEKPDLIVQSITTDPINPVAGQSTSVTVTIKNQGDTTAFKDFFTHLYIDPPSVPKVGDEGDRAWLLDGLAAGQTYAFPSYTTTFTAGTHDLYAQVDVYDQIDEREEGNNVLKKTITVIEGKKPEISLSKTSLNFSVVQGGSNPSNQTFTITNSGDTGSTLNWTGSTNRTWMSLSPISGSLGSGQSETVTVSVDISDLSPRSYEGTITVSDSNATNSPQNIAVTLTITPAAPPILEVSTLSFQFGEIPKPASETRTFAISNSGGGTLRGTVASDRAWISVKPASFSSNNVTVLVTIYTDRLEVWRTYTGAVTVNSNGGVKTINVWVVPTCVKSYPNPYSLSSGKPLTFWGTGVAYATINVYTLSGELVKTLEETEGKDKITWDGSNENGERIVRGIYFFATKSPKERNTGKFTVVR
jgi:flagellar hook assembly protein FlgD